MQPDELLKKFPIISDQVDARELRVILTELSRVLRDDVEGDVVEFGCYEGTTSLFITRLLENQKAFHVYDSFEGLPEKSDKDLSPAGEQFKAGELAATKSKFVQHFKKANLTLPVIHKGWFDELTPDDVPKNISFAFLDGDYYESILVPLKLIWDKLSDGAIVVVDDYQNEALPGASKAVDEWLRMHPTKIRVQSSLAVLYR